MPPGNAVPRQHEVAVGMTAEQQGEIAVRHVPGQERLVAGEYFELFHLAGPGSYQSNQFSQFSHPLCFFSSSWRTLLSFWAS